MENSDLGVWDQAKVIKNTLSRVTQIKSIVGILVDQIKGLPEEIVSIKDAAQAIKSGIDDGSIVEKGESARTKNLTKVLDCYEHAYGKLK